MKRNFALLLSLLFMSLAGCAHYGKWPPFDQSKGRWAVVVGYFESMHFLNEPYCMLSDEEINSGVVDCWARTPPLQATFMVQDLVYGKVPRGRIDVVAGALPGSAGSLPKGPGKPQLLLLSTDGRYYISHGWTEVATLRSRQQAVPVFSEFELRLMPCDMNSKVRPLDFVKPWSSYRVEDLDEETVAEARKTPGLSVSGGKVYIKRGIAVEDIRKTLAGKPEVAEFWGHSESDVCGEW